MLEKIPISGGPNTGKTTLVNALKERFGFHIVPEPATIVITSEKRKEVEDQNYKAILPMTNYSGFGPLVIKKSQELELEIPPTTKVAFLDRCLVDTFAYAKLNNCEWLLDQVGSLVALAKYSKLAFFCEPVGEYESTAIREENRDEATQTHEALRDVYATYEGFEEVVILPRATVERRVDMVIDKLKTRKLID